MRGRACLGWAGHGAVTTQDSAICVEQIATVPLTTEMPQPAFLFPTSRRSGGDQLLGDRLACCRALANAAAMVDDARDAIRIDAVGLELLRQSEEVGIADRVTLAHHP